MGRLLTLLFGCRHPNLSLPVTLQDETYRVCLECGKQIEFTLWKRPAA